MTGTEDGFIALGCVATGGTPAARIWSSPDGLDWSVVDAASTGLGSGCVNDVVVDGESVVAVGTSVSGDKMIAAAWRSSDGGATWGRATECW